MQRNNKKSNSVVVNVGTPVSASSILGISIICLTDEKDLDNLNSSKDDMVTHKDQIVTSDAYRMQLKNNKSSILLYDSSSTETGLLSAVNLDSIEDSNKVSAGKIEIQDTRMMPIIPRKITMNSVFDQYQNVLDVAAKKIKVKSIDKKGGDLHSKVKRLRIFVPVEGISGDDNQKIVATVTNYQLPKDKDAKSPKVNLVTTLSWTKGDLILAKSSGISFDVEIKDEK